MTNAYYNNDSNTIIDGTLAQAADVELKLDDVATGFDLIAADIADFISLSNADNTVRDIPEAAIDRLNKVMGFDSNGDFGLQNAHGEYRSTWTGTTFYYKGDLVKDGANALSEGVDAIWISLEDHTSSAAMGTDVAKWELILSTQELDDAVAAAQAAQTAAEAAQVAAEGAETGSDASAVAAAASAAAALISEGNASTSETNAAASESAADTDAILAAASELAAAASAAAALASQIAAAASETAAGLSEAAAELAETGAVTAYNNTVAIYGDTLAVAAAVAAAEAAQVAAEAAQASATASAASASADEASASVSASQAAGHSSTASTSAANATAYALTALGARNDALAAQAAAEAAYAAGFTGLPDTPSTYSGQGGLVPVVADLEDELQFTDTLDWFTLNNADMIEPSIQDYGELQYTGGSVFGSFQLDSRLGNIQDLTITGDTTFTTPYNTHLTTSFFVVLKGASSHVITWPATWVWAGGVEPTLTAEDILILNLVSGTWYASCSAVAVA